jgi:signal transduction histidine kinase
MKGFYSYGRDALLLETLSIVAKCQDERTFWADAMARLKWILDFTRVDLALRNPDNETYNLQTLFELRPDQPFVSQAGIPLGKGIVGKMIRSGESCHCFSPRTRPFSDECVLDESLERGSLLSILSVSLEADRNVFGVLSFGSTHEDRYSHKDMEVASRFATHAAIAIQNRQQLAKLKEDSVLLDLAAKKLRDSHAGLESLVAERTATLQMLSKRLLKTQDEERRKVARDLHDSTGQTLTALKIQVASLQKQFENGQPAFDALSEIAVTADQALQEIRTTSYLLHPPLLDEAGLASAARWYVEGFSKRSGIKVNLDLPPRAERVPNDIEMVLFRVLQESLVNVHRHSGASIVDIVLKRRPQVVTMEVHDDGKGIAPELLDRLRKANTDGGVGLAGMRERINDLNGHLDIDSSSRGTTLRVSLPLACTDPMQVDNSTRDTCTV